MLNIIKGFAAGFAATLVLSALMMAKSAMGIMPELNVIAMLTQMGHQLMGLDQTLMTGWILHFLIGTVIWVGLFVPSAGILPGSAYWRKGIVFRVIG